MKILYLLPSIYLPDSDYTQFNDCRSGFDMMVYDIIEDISNRPTNKVSVLTLKLTGKFKYNKMDFLSHTKKNILCNIKLKNIVKAVIYFFKYPQSFPERVKNAVYQLNIGYIENVIKVQNPDIIHIHGVTKYSISQFDLCLKLGIPFIITLHGLIGLSDTIKIPDFYKNLEYGLLKKAEHNSVPVTVISEGMINRIAKEYNLNTDNIHVIPNGVKINKVNSKNTIDIKKKYHINDSKEIILCVGSIMERKNQLQIVDAVDLLPDETKNKLVILIIGLDLLNGALEKKISEKKLQDQIKYCGFVEKEKLENYYEQGGYVILASKDEGFGLSIVEGFFYGLPTITFPDLDAIPNLYDKNVMMLAKGRNNEDLANAIHLALAKQWDRDFIKNYSSKFSLELMGEKYQKLYSSITDNQLLIK